MWCFGARLRARLALSALPSDAEQIVVIVADDVGVDRIGAYAEHPRPGRTPNIDRLASRGVLFFHGDMTFVNLDF